MPSNQENSGETAERSAANLESEVEHELGQDTPPKHDPYAVLRLRDFRRYLIGGIFAAGGQQMTFFANGWEIYEITHHSKLALGMLGLVAALPVIFLALPAGSIADRYDRKRVILIADVLAALSLFCLALVSWFRLPVQLYYAVILANAICGAFLGPAIQALTVSLVPPKLLPDALKWSSMRWQLAATLGPVLGGVLIARWHLAAPLYVLDGLGRLLFCALIWGTTPRAQELSKEAINWKSLAAGWHFVKGQPLILSTITLDMVAVLFGGATALLPVYASSEILNVGATGLGYMRAAPAVGAICMGLLLTHLPPFKRAGFTLLWAVSGFGIATIVFGLSHTFWVSLVALFALGALDNISVVIRHTLLQVLTPDSMRGRVSAVNSVFIGTSNQIGELESGVAAHILGPIVAVAGGGALTIVCVGAIMSIWPAIRHFKSFEEAIEKREASQAAASSAA